MTHKINLDHTRLDRGSWCAGLLTQEIRGQSLFFQNIKLEHATTPEFLFTKCVFALLWSRNVACPRQFLVPALLPSRKSKYNIQTSLLKSKPQPLLSVFTFFVLLPAWFKRLHKTFKTGHEGETNVNLWGSFWVLKNNFKR